MRPPSCADNGPMAVVETEAQFQARVVRLAVVLGWSVFSIPDSRRATLAGYPDLTMFRASDKRLVFAELKREKGRLSNEQKKVLADMELLANVGRCEVYLWRPSDWDTIVETLKLQGQKKK